VAERIPRIVVLAGTNGAGKSSIGGSAIRSGGGAYFNPDESARAIRLANPALSVSEANSRAWREGVRLLERAIAERLDFTFETTLGGATITALLQRAIESGIEVTVWYVGLATPELHIERVRERVRRGGHDIPETDIRRRYDQSRLNLIRLLPGLAELQVYDNSRAGNPAAGLAPSPSLVLRMRRGKLAERLDLSRVPEWAKPIAAMALRSSRKLR